MTADQHRHVVDYNRSGGNRTQKRCIGRKSSAALCRPGASASLPYADIGFRLDDRLTTQSEHALRDGEPVCRDLRGPPPLP